MGMRTRIFVPAIVIGLLLGFGTAALDLPFWVPYVTIAAFLAAQQYYCRYLVAWRLRTKLHRSVDANAGPPPAAEPSESPLIVRFNAAKEWKDIAPLLADGFAMIDPKGRRHDKRMYRNSQRAWKRIYPRQGGAIEAILSDPAEPHVVYVRAHFLGHPRRGPLLDMTGWTRYVLTPELERVREIAFAGIVRVG
jgi:hypothetical protein